MSETIGLRELQGYAELPESEFEWEDLLLRLEVMSKALRVEMENIDPVAARPALAELTEREAAVQRLLEEVAIFESAVPGHAGGTSQREAEPIAVADSLFGARTSSTAESMTANEAGVDRFVRLRARNFAMLQRRGIGVWNWRIRSAPAAGATVFQLLSLLARKDVEVLATLRQARAPVPGSC